MNETELSTAYEMRKPALKALGQWVTVSIIAELGRQLGSEHAVDQFLQLPPKPRVKETVSGGGFLGAPAAAAGAAGSSGGGTSPGSGRPTFYARQTR